MADRDLVAAVDCTIDAILRRHYHTEAEREDALRKAMREMLS